MNEPQKDPVSFLSDTFFVPALAAKDKQGVLAELADVMSTGMQYGVAIPHAKTEVVDRLVTMIALAPSGIPFDSLDGEPAQIFIATLSPPSDANSHISFLAVVTRQLANRRVRDRVLAATTREELVAAFEPQG